MAGTMDGTALARAIRARKPQLPVLLVTGYSPAAASASATFPVMRKPFQLADLSRTVTRMIAEARQPLNSNLVRLSDARRSAAVKAEEK
jgi:DNA-binding LytR/AlgR family response regulator